MLFLSEDAEYLQKNARELAANNEIEKQREFFQNISNRLISLVRSHGLDQVGSAYVVHCPMAFGNAGGDWISNVPKVLNPYFGDSMLTCGSVTATLSLGEKPPMKKADDMKDHNHGK
jgi:Cu(I)/Ag(I) efflux system membrane fusion protein